MKDILWWQYDLLGDQLEDNDDDFILYFCEKGQPDLLINFVVVVVVEIY